jgi:hypothetical protein
LVTPWSWTAAGTPTLCPKSEAKSKSPVPVLALYLVLSWAS